MVIKKKTTLIRINSNILPNLKYLHDLKNIFGIITDTAAQNNSL
jgi:hypothetical protein